MSDIPEELQNKLLKLGQVSETLASAWGKGAKSATAWKIAEEQLAKSLEKKLKLGEEESKALASKLTTEERHAKTQEMVNKALIKAVEESISGLKDLATGSISAAQSAANSTDVYASAVPTLQLMGNTIKAVTGAISSALSSIPYVGALLDAGNKAMAAVVDLSVQVMQAKLEQVQKYFNEYQAIAKAGATFGGSMEQVRLASVEMGLSMMRFSKFMTENSQALGEMGLGLVNGAKAVGKMGLAASKTDSMLLSLYGTQENMDSALVGYTNIMAGFGMNIAKNQNALSQSSGDYLWKLKELTEVTGVTAEQHQKEVRERQNNLLYQRRMQDLQASLVRQYGANEGGRRFTAMVEDQELKMSALTRFFNSDVQKLVTEVVGRGGSGNVIDEKSIAILANSPPLRRLADGMVAIQKMETGPERDAAFRNLVTSVNRELATSRESLDNFQGKGLPEFVEFLIAAKSAAIRNSNAAENFEVGTKTFKDNQAKGKQEGNKDYVDALRTKVELEQSMDKWAKENMKYSGEIASTLHQINMKLFKSFNDFDKVVVNFSKWVDKLLEQANKDENDRKAAAATQERITDAVTASRNAASTAQINRLRGMALSPDASRRKEAATEAKAYLDSGDEVMIRRTGGKEFLQAISQEKLTPEMKPADIEELSKKIKAKLGDKATGGGSVDPALLEILEKVIDKYPGIRITSLNDMFHHDPEFIKKYGTSKHTLGKAADLTIPGMNSEMAAALQKDFGFSMAQFEKDGVKGAKGDHIHVETKKFGGHMDDDDTTIVGEDGMEIVSGKGVTTSSASTSKIFSEMVQKLDLIARKVDEHKEVSEHILAQT